MNEKWRAAGEIERPLMDIGIEIDAGATLHIETMPRRAHFNLRIDSAHLTAAATAFGADLPSAIGEIQGDDTRTALRLGPDEFILLAPDAERLNIEGRFSALYEAIPHSLVDVSHREIGLEISGTAARQALNTGCPLDLTGMPAGRGTRTVFDRAEIILLKLDETRFQLVVWLSFAEFVGGVLGAAAREIEAGL